MVLNLIIFKYVYKNVSNFCHKYLFYFFQNLKIYVIVFLIKIKKYKIKYIKKNVEW